MMVSNDGKRRQVGVGIGAKFSKGDAMKEEHSFKPGEMVEILNGPFTQLTGQIRDVNSDKHMLAVIVKDERIEGIILGEALVELGFQEVKKRPDMSSW